MRKAAALAQLLQHRSQLHRQGAKGTQVKARINVNKGLTQHQQQRQHRQQQQQQARSEHGVTVHRQQLASFRQQQMQQQAQAGTGPSLLQQLPEDAQLITRPGAAVQQQQKQQQQRLQQQPAERSAPTAQQLSQQQRRHRAGPQPKHTPVQASRHGLSSSCRRPGAARAYAAVAAAKAESAQGSSSRRNKAQTQAPSKHGQRRCTPDFVTLWHNDTGYAAL